MYVDYWVRGMVVRRKKSKFFFFSFFSVGMNNGDFEGKKMMEVLDVVDTMESIRGSSMIIVFLESPYTRVKVHILWQMLGCSRFVLHGLAHRF